MKSKLSPFVPVIIVVIVIAFLTILNQSVMNKKKQQGNGIYKMELHDSLTIDVGDNFYFKVTRVPGGWIYQKGQVITTDSTIWGGEIKRKINISHQLYDPVFVPFKRPT